MQSGDVSLAGVHFQHLVNNTMLPFVNPATQLVDWSGHQNVTGNQCYRKYVIWQAVLPVEGPTWFMHPTRRSTYLHLVSGADTVAKMGS